VKGVTPRGRRLDAAGSPRAARWSASGVQGVTPPGSVKPGDGPATQWLNRRKQTKKRPPRRADPGAAPGSGRPTVGFVPDVLAGADDPQGMRAFLEEIAGFFREHRPDDSAAAHLAELIGQSHAPYEIVVAFTVLSALLAGDTAQRNRLSRPLERGARAFFNLAMRLDDTVKAPRGLAPQRLDPIFYDVPRTAYQVPYAFATDAFVRIIELLRGDLRHDRLLVRFARDLYQRFIASRSYGDRALSSMFPWQEPLWAPPDDGP
jgi:hypothetical protein